VRLTHIRLLVDDYAACFGFYRDVLGFEPTFGDESGLYADFDTGSDVSLALFVSEYQIAAEPGQGKDGVLIILGAENVDERVEQLRQRGVPIVREPEDKPEWGIRVAYIRDPGGNLLELNHSL
jgi:catechol 2,3-dioxygenase-like lactoylglutathione lyase family enzyme